MHKLFTLFLCVLTFSANAQGPATYVINFENAALVSSFITIDTTNHPSNKWQVGKSQKTTFTAAWSWSVPNAIITDTVNTCMPNDTSVFILRVPFRKNIPGYAVSPLYNVRFYYKLQKDTGDVAMLEVSQDTGMHWYNIKDSLPSYFNWASCTHSIDTGTTLWKSAQFSVTPWSSSVADTADSFLFRFTFISDSSTNNRDGWMIDYIDADYWYEGIGILAENTHLVSVFPNPSAGILYVRADDQKAKKGAVSIHNMEGKEVYQIASLPADGKLELQLPNGIYTLRYTTTTQFCIKQIVISR